MADSDQIVTAFAGALLGQQLGWPSDGPLTPSDEVREIRRQQGQVRPLTQATLDEIEGYDSAAELAAARDLELWGGNPFEED